MLIICRKNDIYNNHQGGVYIFDEGQSLVEHNNVYGKLQKKCLTKELFKTKLKYLQNVIV